MSTLRELLDTRVRLDAEAHDEHGRSIDEWKAGYARALFDVEGALAEASQRSETGLSEVIAGQRELTPAEQKSLRSFYAKQFRKVGQAGTAPRNVSYIWHATNDSRTGSTGRIYTDPLMQQAYDEGVEHGDHTPRASGKLERTAGDVIREFRESGGQDWDQLVSAINYWAMTDFCPRFMGERK